jgi:hypothetical protein
MRLSIRDLLWATVMVAMGLGWWREHAKLAALSESYLSMEMRCIISEQETAAMRSLLYGAPGGSGGRPIGQQRTSCYTTQTRPRHV